MFFFPQIMGKTKKNASQLRNSKVPSQAKQSGSEVQLAFKSTSGSIKKRDRLKIKREMLKEKLKSSVLAEAEKREKKKRQERPIIGDIKSMTDCLEDIETETQQKKKTNSEKRSRAPKSTLKQRKRQQEFLKNVTIFKKIAKHPEFVRNPLGAISTHIENQTISKDNNS